MQINIRDEQPQDFKGIEALTKAAFFNDIHSSHTEQFIVRELRAHGQLSISMVAIQGEQIVGHVAVSPVEISSGAHGWYGLGPISVQPDHQAKGIGSQLMNAALERLQSIGAKGCVLLGDPEYYKRFGFLAHAELVLPDVPPEYFQAISFTGDFPCGKVRYHDAFNASE